MKIKKGMVGVRVLVVTFLELFLLIAIHDFAFYFIFSLPIL